MEHFSTIYACLQEFLSGYILPNSAELLSIYGRVSTFFAFLKYKFDKWFVFFYTRRYVLTALAL